MPILDPVIIESRKKQHAEVKAEVEKRLVANADNLDKSVLTYSSAGLALSLGFLKDFVHVSVANSPWLLYGSWTLFVLAVITTLLSYLSSQAAQRRQLEISHHYNIDLDDTALNETNTPAKLTELASYVAAVAFVLALSASTLFVGLNLSKARPMATPKQERLIEGAPVPSLQRIPDVRGAPVPNIQPMPAPAPSPSAPTPAPVPAPAPLPSQS